MSYQLSSFRHFPSAFAIVAALALMRFRVKLDSKSLSASVLFGVLAGMACGLQEVALAWIMTGFYVVLLAALVVFMIVFKISPVDATAAAVGELELEDSPVEPPAALKS